MATIHEWVQQIFPEVAPRLDDGTVDQQYCFRNTFALGVVTVYFRKNELIFECESASTLGIIKENVTRLANFRRVAVEEFVTANDEATRSFLNLVSQVVCNRVEDVFDFVSSRLFSRSNPN